VHTRVGLERFNVSALDAMRYHLSTRVYTVYINCACACVPFLPTN
jgi:hypothetical protein